MKAPPGEIIRHYESEDEGPRITEGFGQLELLRTQEVIRRHVPAGGPPLRILDVGGAKGAHAWWLADQDGHDVLVVDPVPSHVAAASGLRPSAGRIRAEQGDARHLPVPDDSVDVVLLLGPLYHLTERADRITALREARRVVRPGGPVFVAGISRFASLFDGLARELLFEPDFPPIVEQDLRSGQHRNSEGRPHRFTTAYFHHPDELRTEVEEAGLDLAELVGVEGLAGWLPNLRRRWDNGDERDRQQILHSARVVESEPCLLGLSTHFLVAATRPG